MIAMQLVKEVKRLEVCEGIKKGDILELENVLSCDKQVVKIIEINTEGLKVIKLQNGQTEIYTYEGLMNYEARKMKIVYDTDKSILSQAAQTETKEDRVHKEYAAYMEDMIKQIFGKDADVRSMTIQCEREILLGFESEVKRVIERNTFAVTIDSQYFYQLDNGIIRKILEEGLKSVFNECDSHDFVVVDVKSVDSQVI